MKWIILFLLTRVSADSLQDALEQARAKRLGRSSAALSGVVDLRTLFVLHPRQKFYRQPLKSYLNSTEDIPLEPTSLRYWKRAYLNQRSAAEVEEDIETMSRWAGVQVMGESEVMANRLSILREILQAVDRVQKRKSYDVVFSLNLRSSLPALTENITCDVLRELSGQENTQAQILCQFWDKGAK